MKRSSIYRQALVAATLVSALLLSACSPAESSAPVSSEDVTSEVVSSEGTVFEVSSEETSSVVTSVETTSTVSEVSSVETSSGTTSETASETTSEPPLLQPVNTAGSLAYDSATAASLLSSINTDRTAAGSAALTADTGLDAVAQAYAKVLYEAGTGFRSTTDYKTLPSGEKVSSLIKSSGYIGTVSNFNYSIYTIDATVKGDTMATMTAKVLASSQYTTKAVAGDYTKAGIACGTVSDGVSTSFSIIILVYSK